MSHETISAKEEMKKKKSKRKQNPEYNSKWRKINDLYTNL